MIVSMSAATLLRLMAIGLLTLPLAACAAEGGASVALAGFNPGAPPAEMRHGAALFGSYCSSCHGAFGTGQGLGPPLLDTLYLVPGFDDAAVAAAVTTGVRQRHWSYGAMPPVARVTQADLPAIIGYVRWVQQRWQEKTGKPGAS